MRCKHEPTSPAHLAYANSPAQAPRSVALLISAMTQYCCTQMSRSRQALVPRGTSASLETSGQVAAVANRP